VQAGRVSFVCLAHCMSAVAATAAAHPCDACANKARAVGPSRFNTSC